MDRFRFEIVSAACRELGTTIVAEFVGPCVHRDWRAPCLNMCAEAMLKLFTLKRVERRLLREYLDLPGLSLSVAQAARLVGVDAPSCQLVLNDLVNAHCLTHSESGTYVRAARYGDLGRWRSLVRNRLAAVTQSPSLPTKAVTSVRPQMVGR